MNDLELENAIQRLILKSSVCIISSHVGHHPFMRQVACASNIECNEIYLLADQSDDLISKINVDAHLSLLWEDQTQPHFSNLIAEGICLLPTVKQQINIIESIHRNSPYSKARLQQFKQAFLIKVQRFQWRDNHHLKAQVSYPKHTRRALTISSC